MHTIKITDKVLYIFDFDGVLVDSVDVKTEAFAELYQPYGEEVVRQVVLHHTRNGGMKRFDKFTYYHGQILGLPIGVDVINELSDRFSKIVVKKILDCKEIPGISKLLDYCKTQNIICAINSATPQEELRYIVSGRQWGRSFKYIYGASDTKTSNILKIIRNTSTNPSATIFFGDSENDYAAAKAVGIDFVGINFFPNANLISEKYPNFIDYMDAQRYAPPKVHR